VSNESRAITLTFDNGPTPGVTDQVLDVLAERGLPAVFFPVARNVLADGGRALMERAVREGHKVGNHSLTHGTPLGELGPDQPATEIGRAQEILADLADPARMFRPYGTDGALDHRCLSPAAVEYLAAGGYTCVLWNSIPHDWDDPTGWIDRALAHMRAQRHTVVVLHDLPTGAMDALPRFLDAVQAAGVAVTQELPESCVPMVEGTVRAPLDHLVSAG
jgi:peptidoglycan-N-acetylglucosamine deacetylase